MNYKIHNPSTINLRINIGGQDIVVDAGGESVVQKHVLDRLQLIYPSFVHVLGETEEEATINREIEEDVKNEFRPSKAEMDEDFTETMVPAPKKKRARR